MPTDPPIGLQLSRTAHTVTQAFERAMAEAGGSAATWQVLLLVRSGRLGTQAELAAELGVRPATVTHHLHALERKGLVRRWREPGNRRVQRAALTDDGVALFDRLRHVALAHDARLRSGLSEAELEQLRGLLTKVSSATRPDGLHG